MRTERFAVVESDTGEVMYIGTEQDADDYLFNNTNNAHDNLSIYRITGGYEIRLTTAVVEWVHSSLFRHYRSAHSRTELHIFGRIDREAQKIERQKGKGHGTQIPTCAL